MFHKDLEPGLVHPPQVPGPLAVGCRLSRGRVRIPTSPLSSSLIMEPPRSPAVRAGAVTMELSVFVILVCEVHFPNRLSSRERIADAALSFSSGTKDDVENPLSPTHSLQHLSLRLEA